LLEFISQEEFPQVFITDTQRERIEFFLKDLRDVEIFEIRNLKNELSEPFEQKVLQQ
jgi:hypothetical protein